jgi:hypothetical protein
MEPRRPGFDLDKWRKGRSKAFHAYDRQELTQLTSLRLALRHGTKWHNMASKKPKLDETPRNPAKLECVDISVIFSSARENSRHFDMNKSASQAYDEGSIPFTRSTLFAFEINTLTETGDARRCRIMPVFAYGLMTRR